MNDKNSFVFYQTIDQEQRRLYEAEGVETAYGYLLAVINYGLYGITPNEQDRVWLYGLDQTFHTIDTAKNRYNKAVENGRNGGAPAKYDKEKIAQMKAQGVKNEEIAKQVGCSISTVEKTPKADNGYVF